MSIQRFCCLLLVTCLSFAALQGQVKENTAFVKVSGEVTKPLQLSVTDLAKMKRSTVQLKDRDGVSHSYTGVEFVVRYARE